jgi:hypothetical protein
MRRSSVVAAFLVLAFPAVARAQAAPATSSAPPAPPAPQSNAHVAEYSSYSWEPVRPQFVLGSNTDGSNSVSVNAAFVVDTLPDKPRALVHVTSWSIAPTASFTDSSKSAVVSLGGPSASPNFGFTGFAGGALLAYTLQAPLVPEEELGVLVDLAPIRVQAARSCVARCTATPAPEDAEFCKAAAAPGFDVTSVDPGSLCPAAKTWYVTEEKREQGGAVDAAVRKVTKLRAQRLRYPEIDLSIWGGVGASEFAFYQQTAPAVGTTTPATYAASTTTQWKPSGAGAVQLTAVPWVSDGPLGLTIEVPVFVKAANQAFKKTAAPCSTAGTISATTTLTTCGATAPLGPPSGGAVLTTKGYLGIIDRENAYWRVAIGGGYSRNFVDSSDTWSIELPLYVNATALAAAKESGSSPLGPVEIGYSGIIRVTPTVQRSTAGSSTGWTALLNFDLLGQRNMFTRADALVK